MQKENGKIRSEYLLAALMCIAVAFFLTILIVSKSCSADLPEEDGSSVDATSDPTSEPPVSSTPSTPNVSKKVENVRLEVPAKVSEGVLAPTTDEVLDPDAENPGAPSSGHLMNGGVLSGLRSKSSEINGSLDNVPFGFPGGVWYMREDAIRALSDIAKSFRDANGKQLIVRETYGKPGVSELGEAVAENLDTGCAVLFASGYLNGDQRIWLADNCFRFGFILRYPADKSDVTHQEGISELFRYVGYEHAAYMGSHHQTLEEYLDFLRRETSSEKPLQVNYTDSNGDSKNCVIYFVPVSGGEVGELPIYGGEGTEFRYTGNGSDGIIVTCIVD